MIIPVGPVPYELMLASEPIMFEGRRCRALCDGDERRILIDSRLRPRDRVIEFWHELAHAFEFELDIHETGSLGGESLARLVALGMAMMDITMLCRIHVYLRHGVEAAQITMHNGLPIPMFEIHEIPLEIMPFCPDHATPQSASTSA